MRSLILAILLLLPIISDAPAPRGLVRDRKLCRDGYRIIKLQFCSHGPDNDDHGFDPHLPPLRGPVPQILCDGDGVSGKRVQMIYAREQSQPDRYAEKLSTFLIDTEDMDRIFEVSALKTGGRRRIRFVTLNCEVVIDNVVVPDGMNETIGGTMQALRDLGYTSEDRKYVIFVDSDIYCGIGTVYGDTSPGTANKNNSNTGYARVDRDCWSGRVAAHELIHTLGGVQPYSPNNSLGGWHCVDEYDLMCYKDSDEAVMLEICPTTQGNLLDCGNDDYYNTAPAAGTYLSSHYNIATDSLFLLTPAEPDKFVTHMPFVLASPDRQ